MDHELHELASDEYDSPPNWVRVMRICIKVAATILGCVLAAGIAALVWRLM